MSCVVVRRTSLSVPAEDRSEGSDAAPLPSNWLEAAVDAAAAAAVDELHGMEDIGLEEVEEGEEEEEEAGEEVEAALVSPPPLDSLPMPRVGAGAEGQSPPPLLRTASPAAAMALLRGAQGRDGPGRDALATARP